MNLPRSPSPPSLPIGSPPSERATGAGRARATAEEPELIVVGNTGFLLRQDLAFYAARPAEEFPVREDHLRLFLANRLRRTLDDDGLVILQNSLGFVVARDLAAVCERTRQSRGLSAVIPVSLAGLIAPLFRTFDAVLSIEEDSACLRLAKPPSVDPGRSEQSSQALAKVETADGIPVEFSARRFGDRIAEVFGARPTDLSAFLDAQVVFPGVDEGGLDPEVLERFARLQPAIVPAFAAIREWIPATGRPMGILGPLSRSRRFLRFLEHLLQVDVVPVGDVPGLLERMAKTRQWIAPPSRFRPPAWTWLLLAFLLTLNLFIHHRFLGQDLELMQGILSLDRAIRAIWQGGGQAVLHPGDGIWLQERLAEWRFSWSRLFRILEASKPDHLMVDQIRMLPRGALRIEIQGLARGMAEILAFQEALQQASELDSVFLSGYRMQRTFFQFTLALVLKPAPSRTSP